MASNDPDDTPTIPSAHDADNDVESTPAGTTDELEEEIEERDADVAPDAD